MEVEREPSQCRLPPLPSPSLPQLPQTGARFNIIGAIAYNNLEGGRKHNQSKRGWGGGHLLTEALKVWRGGAVGKGKKATAPKAHMELADYHGNMNADFFEEWFRVLCRDVLTKEEYGRCLIKMDGAK